MPTPKANSGSRTRVQKRRVKKRHSPLRPKSKRHQSANKHSKSRDRAPQSAAQDAEKDDATQSANNVSTHEGKPVGIRLQKLLADRGYGSRRKMESWIKEGKVEVNGAVAQLGQRVSSKDLIRVSGRMLREQTRLSNTRVLMYNKPEGEICTTNDPRRRPTVFRKLPKIRGARWVAVGRLDINTSGLLLFTTNGELANRLMHPSSGIEREYRCRIFGQIESAMIKSLLDGIQIDNHLMRFNKVVVEDMDGDKRNKWVHVTLEEGRNREVRKLWEAVGCQVSRLTRVRYDFLTLPRNLRPGGYRELTDKEIRRLVEI